MALSFPIYSIVLWDKTDSLMSFSQFMLKKVLKKRLNFHEKKKLWKLEGKIQILCSIFASSFSCSNLYRKVLLLIFSFFYLYYYDIFQMINR